MNELKRYEDCLDLINAQGATILPILVFAMVIGWPM
jgi:hypothetical protein